MEDKKSKRKLFRLQRREGFGSPFRVIANTIIIFLASQLIAGFIVALAAAARHGNVTDLINDSIVAQFFYVLIAESLAASLVLWLVRRRKLGLVSIGLARRPQWRDLKWALMGAAGFYALVVLVSIILSALVSNNILNEQQDVGFSNISTSFERLLTFFSLVIIPPIAEEILVRGYLFSGLRKFWRFWPALLATSLLFGLAHLSSGIGGSLVWQAAIDTFVLSVVLVYVRDRSGALYAGMLVHAFNNLIAFSVHFK